MTAPKTLFLIDGLGGVLSTLCLIGILYFDAFSGMPESSLYLFITIGSCCAVYSLSCYVYKPEKWRKYLKLSAAANLFYCVLTAIAVEQHADRLTLTGYSYFIAEIIVIVILALCEFRAAFR